MEVWRNIKDFNYSVSDMGRVKSNKSGRIIKPWKLRQGYLQVGLMREGSRFRLLVHRLVAETFIDNPEDKESVNHIDLDKSNNELSNLEWVTRSENMQHASLKGVLKGYSKRYSKDFITEVLSFDGGLLETCRFYNIHPGTVSYWLKNI